MFFFFHLFKGNTEKRNIDLIGHLVLAPQQCSANTCTPMQKEPHLILSFWNDYKAGTTSAHETTNTNAQTAQSIMTTAEPVATLCVIHCYALMDPYKPHKVLH